jgi:ribosomal protein L11 methyltransferase
VSWIEVRASLPPAEDQSPFIEIFRGFGIENTLEDGTELVGCIVDVQGTAAQLEGLEAALRFAGALEVTTSPFEEQNWAEVWKQFFHPRRVGQRLVVRPTWEEFESKPDDLVIVLDPGEAFGTGDHATTRLSLELLERAVGCFESPASLKIADVGCGSGILSIGACLLGAGEVDSVDIDPTSVEVARANARLNNVSFHAVVGDGIHVLNPPYHIVVSNIISAVLMGMAPDVAAALVPGGQWIVSGILLDNWPLVLSAATRTGFSLIELQEDADWVGARFHLA